jgi:predicted nicotinamide N-methyase
MPDLSDRFRLRTHSFRHGAFAAELLSPAAPEELIDVSEFNVDERLPYWAELWPSARALAAELLDLPLPPGRVLELGCGIALPSLALRWRGVQVVASDYYPEALEFARANAAHNRMQPPGTLLLDWRHPPEDLQPFPLVVAADVLYERRNAEALAGLLPRVTAPDGRVLLADPGRTYVQDFRAAMAEVGWAMEETARREERVEETGRTASIRLWSLWRSRPPVISGRRSCRRS